MKYLMFKNKLGRKIVISFLLNLNVMSATAAYTDHIIYEMKVQLTGMIASLIELHTEEGINEEGVCSQVQNFITRSEVVRAESVYKRHLPYNADIDKNIEEKLDYLKNSCNSGKINPIDGKVDLEELAEIIIRKAHEGADSLSESVERFFMNQEIFEKDATRVTFTNSTAIIDFAKNFTGLDKLNLNYMAFGCSYNVNTSYFADGITFEIENADKKIRIARVSHTEANEILDSIKKQYCP